MRRREKEIDKMNEREEVLKEIVIVKGGGE